MGLNVKYGGRSHVVEAEIRHGAFQATGENKGGMAMRVLKGQQHLHPIRVSVHIDRSGWEAREARENCGPVRGCSMLVGTRRRAGGLNGFRCHDLRQPGRAGTCKRARRCRSSRSSADGPRSRWRNVTRNRSLPHGGVRERHLSVQRRDKFRNKACGRSAIR